MRTTAHPPEGISLGCSTSKWWVEGLWGEKNTQTMVGSETIYTFPAGDCVTLVQRLSKGKRIFSPYLIELKSWLWELTEYLESLAWKSFSNLVHSKFGVQSAYTHCSRSPSVPLLSLDYCFSSYWFLFPKPTTHHEKFAEFLDLLNYRLLDSDHWKLPTQFGHLSDETGVSSHVWTCSCPITHTFS